MARLAPVIELSKSERQELESLARARKTGQALAKRARIVLAAAAGLDNKTIVSKVGSDPNTVSKWRRRFAERRLDGLYDEPRPGAPRTIDDQAIAETIRLTLETTPDDATHWSLRSMAKKTGYAPSTIHRLWKAFSLQPHRTETFKLSTDPLFVDKVRDIAGLYMAPPERALVLCVDEKSQIQALDRSQPMLPMQPGQIERRTHDYKRHGTTSLFAALDIATGAVIGRCYPRHRAIEFKKFLDEIETNVPANLEIHLIMDNYATHKTKRIRDWLANGHAGTSTSPQPAPHGSTRSNASSGSSLTSRSGGASTIQSRRWKRTSTPLSTTTIKTQNHSAGPVPPTIFYRPFNGLA